MLLSFHVALPRSQNNLSICSYSHNFDNFPRLSMHVLQFLVHYIGYYIVHTSGDSDQQSMLGYCFPIRAYIHSECFLV